jgi:hypothetical protein
MAAQAVELHVRAGGAVELDEHRQAWLCTTEDQRGLGLQDTLARARRKEAREQARVKLRAPLGRLLLARIDLHRARGVPLEWHRAAGPPGRNLAGRNPATVESYRKGRWP